MPSKQIQHSEDLNFRVLKQLQDRPDISQRDLAEARHGYLRAWLQLRQLSGVLDSSDLERLAGYFDDRGLLNEAD